VVALTGLLPVLADAAAVTGVLSSVWLLLAPGGIMLGSTAGAPPELVNQTFQWRPAPATSAASAPPQRFLHSAGSLSQLLESMGFINIQVRVKELLYLSEATLTFLEFSAFKPLASDES
jgi:hypothetical protein